MAFALRWIFCGISINSGKPLRRETRLPHENEKEMMHLSRAPILRSPTGSEAKASLPLPGPHTKAVKNYSAKTTRKPRITVAKPARFWRKVSCFRPMLPGNTPTGKPCGTLRKRWRNNGTASYPAASLWHCHWKSRKNNMRI